MVHFLSENPWTLLFMTCCLTPAIAFGLGYLVARYRPRFRMPFTLERDDIDDLEL